MNYSWQPYFAQIAHGVENVDHAYIIFKIQKERKYLNYLHKNHQGNHHHHHLESMGTTISTTRSIEIMSLLNGGSPEPLSQFLTFLLRGQEG